MRSIQIPEKNSGGQVSFDMERSLVIVGANGSGKTRFGTMIEQWNNPSKRISAQRHLRLNEVVQRQDPETAETQLRAIYKNRPAIQPQEDYDQVLISLFAQEARRDAEVVKLIKSSVLVSADNLPLSIKEAVVEVWNFIFPHRVLKLENDRVRAASEDGDFSGSEMSDGEKVGLYLISQILLAESGCILIIDEPELHLHKALMVRLWNKLEEQRKDCTFIYITHDLDFAANKHASKIIWIRSYKNNQWDWAELPPNEVIPENLYFEVLGSRKPILFIEGDKGSLDAQLYQAIYEDFTVIPRGSCEKVIEAVRGLKNNENLHDKKVLGLIDRDFRTDEQIKALEDDGIFCTVVNEVENLFLLPDIIHIVCDHQAKSDKKEDILSLIKKHYSENKETVSFCAAKYNIQRLLNEKFGSIKNRKDYEDFKTNVFNDTDKELTLRCLPDDVEVLEILKIYPHKGLVRQAQRILEFSGNGYQSLVLSFILSEKREDVLSTLKTYLPIINTQE